MEITPTLKDSGDGITDESLRFWRDNKTLIGRVLEVRCSYDPIHIEVEEYDGILIQFEWNLLIVGIHGDILLSGCNCGYGGTGPNGTCQILEELGIPHDKAEALMYRQYFTVRIAE